MNIDQLRSEIDKIDDKILELVAKRYELVKKVGEIKQSENTGVFVAEREKVIIERLTKKASSILPKEAILAVFREIMSGARLVEHPITIAYLKNDLLSLLAAYSTFGNCIKLKEFSSLEELTKETENNLNTYAVIPSFDCKNSNLKVISEISLQNPSDLRENLKFFAFGRNKTREQI